MGRQALLGGGRIGDVDHLARDEVEEQRRPVCRRAASAMEVHRHALADEHQKEWRQRPQAASAKDVLEEKNPSGRRAEHRRAYQMAWPGAPRLRFEAEKTRSKIALGWLLRILGS